MGSLSANKECRSTRCAQALSGHVGAARKRVFWADGSRLLRSGPQSLATAARPEGALPLDCPDCAEAAHELSDQLGLHIPIQQGFLGFLPENGPFIKAHVAMLL